VGGKGDGGWGGETRGGRRGRTGGVGEMKGEVVG